MRKVFMMNADDKRLYYRIIFSCSNFKIGAEKYEIACVDNSIDVDALVSSADISSEITKFIPKLEDYIKTHLRTFLTENIKHTDFLQRPVQKKHGDNNNNLELANFQNYDEVQKMDVCYCDTYAEETNFENWPNKHCDSTLPNKRDPENVGKGTVFLENEKDQAGLTVSNAKSETEFFGNNIRVKNLHVLQMLKSKIETGSKAHQLNKRIKQKKQNGHLEHILKSSCKNRSPEEDFTCVICQKTVKTKNSLKRHILFQHLELKSKVYKCLRCPKTFTSFHFYKVHQHSHRNQLRSGKYLCVFCRKMFASRSSYLVHVRLAVCQNPEFSCDECGKIFTLKSRYKIHRQKIHGWKNDKMIGCNDCDKLFVSKNGLKKHKKKAKCVNSHICQECGRHFQYPNLLKAHLKSHMPQPKSMNTIVSESSDSFTDSPKLNPKKGESASVYRCHICNCTFRHRYSLTKHKRNHENIRPFKCTTCEKTFSEKYALKIHMRTHTGEKPYLCSQCGKSFISNSKLMRHSKSHKDRFKNKFESSLPKSHDDKTVCKDGNLLPSDHHRSIADTLNSDSKHETLTTGSLSSIYRLDSPNVEAFNNHTDVNSQGCGTNSFLQEPHLRNEHPFSQKLQDLHYSQISKAESFSRLLDLSKSNEHLSVHESTHGSSADYPFSISHYTSPPPSVKPDQGYHLLDIHGFLQDENPPDTCSLPQKYANYKVSNEDVSSREYTESPHDHDLISKGNHDLAFRPSHQSESQSRHDFNYSQSRYDFHSSNHDLYSHLNRELFFRLNHDFESQSNLDLDIQQNGDHSVFQPSHGLLTNNIHPPSYLGLVLEAKHLHSPSNQRSVTQTYDFHSPQTQESLSQSEGFPSPLIDGLALQTSDFHAPLRHDSGAHHDFSFQPTNDVLNLNVSDSATRYAFDHAITAFNDQIDPHHILTRENIIYNSQDSLNFCINQDSNSVH